MAYSTDGRPQQGVYTQQQPPPPQYYTYGPHPPPQPVYVYVTPAQPPMYESDTTVTRGGFTTKEVRLKFVRKVYLILTVELLFTAGIVALFLYEPTVKGFVQRNTLLMYLAIGIFFVVYLVLICVKAVRRTFPCNLIMLMIVTAAQSYMVGTITSFYDEKVVLISIGITTFVTFAVSMFAMQTKYDFTMCGMFLFCASIILLLFGLFAIFFYNQIVSLIYSALAAVLFTLYLAFDTQLIMGGRSIELSPEEYILGALMLYVDIIMIFVNITHLLQSADL